MRKRYAVTLAAGGRWPDIEDNVPRVPFNWVKIDNQGGSNPVDFGLNAQPTGDKLGTVNKGICRVFNVAGPHPPGSDSPDAGEGWPTSIHLVSASGTTVLIEIADHPIVDMSFTT